MAGTATVDPFADLAIEESNEPLPSIVRGGHAGPNPFTDKIEASVANDTSYTFYITPEQVTRAIFLINSAAKKQNRGVRVWVDVQRKDGKVVKGKDGKAIHNLQTQGANKGKVMVRFQAKAERKQQTAPRPYSVVKDRNNANLYHLRKRGDKSKTNLMSGDHAKVKAEYDRLTAEAKSA